MENNIYFTQLKGHLVGLTDEEREDVLDFYREYASDAGLTGETLIREFGTPKQLARRVLVDYSIRYDDVADQDAPEENETPVHHFRERIGRQFNLLWVVLVGLVTSVVWIPAMILILLGLFIVIVIAVFLIMLLLAFLATGLFQVVGAVAIIGTSWQTALYQGGIGLILIGLQFIAWPIGFAIVRVIFGGLMNFVKYVGRKFSRKQEGGTKHA
ncbi:DUF1700 domain-containing protein [Weissella cibaria]|uniref:DUF1700 domain-containing protein n=1 Tax=Weissella cibaria TaxID=137591 RepID=A0A2S1KNJ4_9LACO|nr:hypothetical protein [Weissella cibaria]AWF94503.1 hypothetical protein B6254_0046 [Weissella cibaria]QDG81174.1 hypothetical protein Wei3612_07300 [Weissella cibaria]QMU88662.1 hypothetical protein H3N00_00950 [Weissella cibaria]TVV26481.1 hypothetical protein FO435_00420 [Weissella cibaria]TVV39677.1 hypothetical protein FO438_00255 [Weissella cibaria]